MYLNKRLTVHKVLALLLFSVILFTTVLNGTFAQIITKTPSFINTFLSGLDPTGDLIISKQITHPFGDDYKLPEGLRFELNIAFGNGFAEKKLNTSQGEKVADEQGNITVNVVPGGAVEIYDLPVDTSVVVTETESAGFTPKEGPTRSVAIQRGENKINYVNEYNPAPVNPVNLTVDGTKLLEGRDWQEGDCFEFLLEYKVANGNKEWQSVGNAVVTYESTKPDFDRFSFSDSIQKIIYDVAGEYSFRVSEIAGSIDGIEYDKAVSYFDVTVGDAEMDGALEIQNVTVPEGSNATVVYDESVDNYDVDIVVTNRYVERSDEVNIQIYKGVESSSGKEKLPAGYSFEIYDESRKLVSTSAETSAAGEAAISLVYEAEDAGKTFHYTLKETYGGETRDGVTYDPWIYEISVSVVDNNDGTISAYVYDTEDYRTELVEEEQSESNQLEEEQLDPVQLEEEQLELTLPEVIENNENLTEQIRDNIFVSASAENSVREMTVIPEGASDKYSVSFTNIYDPKDAIVSFQGMKILEGRSLNADEFQFDLYETGNDFSVSESQEPAQSVTNDAEGKITFGEIRYDKIGAHYYVIKENTTHKLRGITYDDSVFCIVVNVTDKNGELDVSVNISDILGTSKELVFKNSYKAEGIKCSLTGIKKLTGLELKADMFRFLLFEADEHYNVQGTAAAVAYNNADGKIFFDNITCDTLGTYYYVVKEDTSSPMAGMTYDDTVYGIEVVVRDDGTGLLKEDIKISEIGSGQVDEIVFENSYSKVTEPDEPDKPEVPEDTDAPADPKKESADKTLNSEASKDSSKADTSDGADTGDSSPVGMYIALITVSFVVIMLIIIVNRKKHKENSELKQ